MKTGATWQRREIVLKDATTNKKIQVKLWNESAKEVSETHQGATIKLTNVEVDNYQNNQQLKTLDVTSIEVSL